MKIIGIESASLVASAAIWEDEKLLAEYNEEEIRLAPENQEVYCIIRTGEEEECSGEYQVKFYMNSMVHLTSCCRRSYLENSTNAPYCRSWMLAILPGTWNGRTGL